MPGSRTSTTPRSTAMSSAPSPARPGKAGSPPPEAPATRPPPPTIRLGRPSDLDDLLALEERCFPAEDRFPRRSWRRLLTTSMRERRALVLVIEGAGLAAAIAGLLRTGSHVL